MNRKEFEALKKKVARAYITDIDFTSWMDQASMETTDEQWEELAQYLDSEEVNLKLTEYKANLNEKPVTFYAPASLSALAMKEFEVYIHRLVGQSYVSYTQVGADLRIEAALSNYNPRFRKAVEKAGKDRGWKLLK